MEHRIIKGWLKNHIRQIFLRIRILYPESQSSLSLGRNYIHKGMLDQVWNILKCNLYCLPGLEPK